MWLRSLLQYWAVRSDRERDAGRYRRAERYARKALLAAERSTAPDDPLRLRLWNALGMARRYQGRFAAAARAYATARRILAGRPDREALASLDHNLGGLEFARGRLSRAEVYARRGLGLRLAVLGAEHPDVARDLAALAAILDARGRHAEAEAMHRRALGILRRGPLPSRREVALALSNLAACLHRQGRSAEAEETGVRALVLSRRALGPRHPETLVASRNLDVIRRAAPS